MSTLTLAAIQTDLAWLDKNRNFAKLEKIINDFFSQREPQQAAVDLLLLPETFSTGFCTHDPSVREPEGGGRDVQWLKQMAQKHQCVVAGSVFVAVGDKKANRFYWVWPDGHTAHYDKRHLFRLGNEGDYVVQGQDRPVFEINGIRILPQVCYDLRFPVWSRNRADYDLMVNVANWPAARRHVWDTLLKARAMENQAYVVGVNRIGEDANGVAHSGGTVFLDFVGEPIAAAEDNTQQIICTTLDFEALAAFKKGFPAHLDADGFELD